MKSTQDGKDTAKERQSMMDALTKMLEMADNLSDASCYESIKQNAIFTTKMMQYKMDAKGLDVTSRDVPNQVLSLTGSSLDPPSLALTTTSSMDSLSTMSNVFRNIAAESPPDIKAVRCANTVAFLLEVCIVLLTCAFFLLYTFVRLQKRFSTRRMWTWTGTLIETNLSKPFDFLSKRMRDSNSYPGHEGTLKGS